MEICIHLGPLNTRSIIWHPTIVENYCIVPIVRNCALPHDFRSTPTRTGLPYLQTHIKNALGGVKSLSDPLPRKLRHLDLIECSQCGSLPKSRLARLGGRLKHIAGRTVATWTVIFNCSKAAAWCSSLPSSESRSASSAPVVMMEKMIAKLARK